MDEIRPTLNRRMREILQLIRENNLEVSLPIDNQEILWDPVFLEKLGVLHHVFDLKNNKSFLQGDQPLFIVPNDERRTLKSYENDNFRYAEDDGQEDGHDVEDDDEYTAFEFHEEEWEWAGILDGLETEMIFDDPYPDIESWGVELDSQGGQPRAGPKTVPFVSSNSEKVGVASTTDMLQLEGIECLAWYTPKGSARRLWGIYIQRYAAAVVAESFFRDMDSRYQAWCLASRLILNHEYFHFLSQYHCDRTYTGEPRTERYAMYDRFWTANPIVAMEEAAANGYAFQRSAKTNAEKKFSEDFLFWMPEPYNRFKEFLPPVGVRAVVYQQEHRTSLPALTDLNPTSNSVFKPTPAEKVPIYFVDFVPGGHVGPKMVTFEHIVFSKAVSKRIKKGKVPEGVVKKLRKTILALKGGTFDRVKDLYCMNSKTHFAQKNLNGGWQAIWAQIKDRNGWVIVFLGDHDEYQHYQTVHGL